ncbi:MAG TPA: hypothetical protein VNF47_06125 [Streptosporangiaceae bacterium]|nr:hypothetical protein [Streptosporangiaceae bacterium]
MSHSAESRLFGSGGVIPLATVVCCAVIGLDQFLHTKPAVLTASPFEQTVHWLGDVALALPIVAIALWAGGWLGSRLRISTADATGVFAQASVIALVLAALLIPAWFAHYGVDSVAQSQAAPSALSELPSHAGHSHGSAPVETHWVGAGVLYVLMSIPLAAGAVCAGHRFAGRLTAEADFVVRAAMAIGAAALALALGWFLQGVADQSGGLLTYTSTSSVVAHAHFAHAHLATVTDAVVPTALGYQLAHAVQDGLAGQAAGLPVIFAGLLWFTRRERGAGGAGFVTAQLHEERIK